jgi:hypothetical protein
MAVRRAYGMMRERDAAHPPKPCHECGTDIPYGAGMAASLGLACTPACYDAMADRPGRVRDHRAKAAVRGRQARRAASFTADVPRTRGFGF